MENFQNVLIRDLQRIYDTSGKNRVHICLIIVRKLIISSAFRAIFFYRLSTTSFSKIALLNRTIQVIPIFKLFKLELSPYTIIGAGVNFPHPDCIIIHHDAIIGKNATIFQNVTIGGNLGKIKNGMKAPIIGDNVIIGAGAKIIGPVKIGDNCKIGVNAVVTKDIPENSVAVGIPAKVIRKVDKP